LIYEIADAPQPLGPRQDRAQVESLVKETHLDDQLKAFGMWQEWEQGHPRPRPLGDNQIMQTHWSFWLGFNLFVLVMLGLDLGVFHRKSTPSQIQGSSGWSAFWIALAFGFPFSSHSGRDANRRSNS